MTAQPNFRPKMIDSRSYDTRLFLSNSLIAIAETTRLKSVKQIERLAAFGGEHNVPTEANGELGKQHIDARSRRLQSQGKVARRTDMIKSTSFCCAKKLKKLH